MGALASRKRVRGASGPRIGGAAGWVALASCVRGRGCARGRGCVAGVRRAVGGCATPLLSVTGVTHAPWNKCAATGVTRVGRVVFTRSELTCCSRARMLGVNCRLRSCVVRVMMGVVYAEVEGSGEAPEGIEERERA